jgi:RND family efflux transporter MFP subunit
MSILTKRHVVVPLAIAAVAIGLAARWKPAENAAIEPAFPPRLLEVSVAAVNPRSHFVRQRKFTGLVVAHRQTSLSFKHPGRVVELLVDDGDRVRADQVLARLDMGELDARKSQLEARVAEARARLEELRNGPRDEEIRVARADVDRLAAEHKLARSRHLRNETLFERGTLSRDAFNESLATSQSLAAQLAAAVATRDRLESGTRQEQLDAQAATLQAAEAARDEVNVQLRESTLLAPFAGTIAARRVDEGTVVSPGQTIFELVESEALEFRVGLPQEIVDWLITQRSVPQTLSIGSEHRSATLKRVLPTLHSATRTRTLVFELGNVPGLVPGQTGELLLSLSVEEEGLWLPNSALASGVRGLWSCHVLVPSEAAPNGDPVGLVEPRDLEILHVEADRSYVRGTIEADDWLIVDGPHRVTPGQRVRGLRQTKESRE